MEPQEELNDYLFDLRGYFVLERAVEHDLLDALDSALSEIPSLEPGEWWGNLQRAATSDPDKGIEYQNIVEGGEAFERLIDHPSWIDYMQRYCGEIDSLATGLFIDECFAQIRTLGGYLRLHSGGYRKALRGVYHHEHGVFRCAQVNVLIALSDIGDGDGGTLIIPGSHKSNLPHPQTEQFRSGHMDDLVGAISPELRRGDALVFSDALAHGAATRANPEGERRTIIYRYGPAWGATRLGYRYSDALVERLTPEAARIIRPIQPRMPPG